MREQRQPDDRHQHHPDANGLPRRRLHFDTSSVTARHHLVTPPGQRAFADQKKGQRQHQHEDHERVAHRVGVDLVDGVENLHRHKA